MVNVVRLGRRVARLGYTSVFCLLPMVSANAAMVHYSVIVDGETNNFSVETDEKGLFSDNQSHTLSNGDEFSLDLSGDTDPFVNASIGIVDFGAASTFQVSVITPLVPELSGLVTSTLSLFGGVTVPAELGSGGYSVLPTWGGIAEATIEGEVVQSIGGAESFPPFGGNITSGGTVSTVVDCGLVGDGGNCSSFDVQIGFQGTGGGTGVSLTAIHDLQEVPLPAAAWLFLSAMAGLGLARSKQEHA